LAAAENQWGDKEDGVPWGAPNVANAGKPEAHRVEAFDDPKQQTDKIVNLLMEVVTNRVLEVSKTNAASTERAQQLAQLSDQVKGFRESILNDTDQEVTKLEGDLSSLIHGIFPEYQITLDAGQCPIHLQGSGGAPSAAVNGASTDR
jgi:putative ATP-dependent endonuclease of OLD family